MAPPAAPGSAAAGKREGWRAPLSRGDSTVSARDSTYWLAVASASSSISARSFASASSPSSSSSPSAHTLKQPGAGGADNSALSVLRPAEAEAETEPQRATDAKPNAGRLQLATSPLHGGAFANPLRRALQAAAEAAAAAAPPPPPRRVAQEAVFENQRYQLVLGWGSKGHLLPLDPGKFMRQVRRPRRGGLDCALVRKSRRRRSLGDCAFGGSPLLTAERRSDPGTSDDNDIDDNDDNDDNDNDDAFDVEWVHSPTFPDVSLPACADGGSRWEWISPWHLEFAASGDRGPAGAEPRADADGWQYATSFQHFEPTARQGANPLVAPAWRPKHHVRCRKWVRYRRLRATTTATATTTTTTTGGNGDSSSSSAFDDAFLDARSGWLRKRGHVRKNWKARYFVLERSVLRYYADASLARLKGEVLLFHPAARVHYVDVHLSGGRDCAFAVHVGRDYALLLQAAHLSERESWIYCLEDALLCRDSYYQDDDDDGPDSDTPRPDRLARRGVRESVALRRKLSAESMVLFNATQGTGRAGSNLVALVGAQAAAAAVRQEASPVLRLLAECDAFLEAPRSGDSGGRRRSRGASHADTLQAPDTATATTALDDAPSVAVLHDARSLSAFESYRFFVERSLSVVLGHLAQLPFVTGASPVTSPTGWKPAAAKGAKPPPPPLPRPADAAPLVSDDEWQLVRKAALYKLERRTFIPLQDVLYALLESTVCPDDLADFERNRQFLGAQPQAFFEIPASLASRSQWNAATALLDTVDNYSLPCEKAAVLLEVARCIYATHAREQGARQAPQMMAADDFLPIFIFVLARCSLRNAVVTRHLISETMISALMLGETGYYATMLEAAVGYIASFDIATAAPTTTDATTTGATTTTAAAKRWRESELQHHRSRLNSIQGGSVGGGASPQKSAALGGCGQRPHASSRGDRRAESAAPKLPSRSQAPAANSQQAQVDRDNLILIKKIVALDNSSRSKPTRGGAGSATRLPRRSNRGGGKTGRAAAPASGAAFAGKDTTAKMTWAQYLDDPDLRNTVVVSAGSSAFSTHGCPHPLPDVPPAACHPLYTHGSATMRNNFADTNGSTLQLSRRQSSRSAHVKIQDENKKLLQRILTARTSYSRAQWSEQERERLKLLRNISRRPSVSLRGSASSGRLPPRQSESSTRDTHEFATPLSPTRQTRSNSELATMASFGIRLDSTSFLEERRQQRRHQRPLSASASVAGLSALSLAAAADLRVLLGEKITAVATRKAAL
ncbi:hypothetical protein PybrP1_002917 [[Pythium] brassicae (nom. inval.)]|nr:hypothetical protein PybrP1_002917 [[Pythium] brassicae (nom. inval.)]